MSLSLPKILDIPDKLLPVIEEFNNYKYFLLEGGRGSGKTHTVARILTYLSEIRNVRIVCGREIQSTIEDSVYTIFADLITEFELDFEVLKNKITHRKSGSTVKFKGFREQGSVNIKGLQGVDIVWIDEAESITKRTLEILIPTIRKKKVKFIFSMNRFMRDDPVFDFCVGRGDCLHININYFDNPFCPLTLKIEAEEMRNKSERDYNHIWLGRPLSSADDYLFNYDKLLDAKEVDFFGGLLRPQRVLGIDFAAQGNDQCVVSVLDRRSVEHWELVEQKAWDESDAMISVGKIVAFIGEYKPEITILDVGGMGHVVYNRLIEVGMDITRFDGAETKGIDKTHYVNKRAEGYYLLKDWVDRGCLRINEAEKDSIIECSKIKMKFRSDGRRIIQPKVEMKKELGNSPDRADSLMMAVYGAIKHLKDWNSNTNTGNSLKRVSSKTRRKG